MVLQHFLFPTVWLLGIILKRQVLAIMNLSGHYFPTLCQLTACDYFLFIQFIKVGPPRLLYIQVLQLLENL